MRSMMAINKDFKPQTTPSSSQVKNTVFGGAERKTMITNHIENEHINRVGPGPEAYDHLTSLKQVIAKKQTTL